MRTVTLPSRALLFLAAATLNAQTTPTPAPTTSQRKPRTPKPAPPLFNTGTIFLDPAHGGSDPGATLAPGSLEKDATLAFAKSLRTLLVARGFTVLLTHESAATPIPPPPRPAPPADATPDQLADFAAQPAPPPFNPNANNPSLDARAEQANRSRAAACIILHATASGRGVHLYTSALTAAPAAPPDPLTRPIVPWDSAQAAILPYSTRLAAVLAGTLAGSRIPLVTGHISTRPVDSLTCPALTLELAPLDAPATDPAYQQRVAQAVVAALSTWRDHALPPAPTPPSTPTQPEKPKPRPKSLRIPSESPVTNVPAATPPRIPQ